MPVRIYSLAKELKLDSKVLVDICTSAGVTGKGSALASLTDEEVDRVKAYHGRSGRGGKAARAKPRTRRRRDPPTRRRSQPPIADARSCAARTTSRPTGTARRQGAGAGRSRRRRSRRNGDTGPARPDGRHSARSRDQAGAVARRDAARPAGRAGRSAAPQKPDLRLPIDAIKAASRGGGTKPLIDHVRKHAGQASPATSRPRPGSSPRGPVPPRGRGERPTVTGTRSPADAAAPAGSPRRWRPPRQARDDRRAGPAGRPRAAATQSPPCNQRRRPQRR